MNFAQATYLSGQVTAYVQLHQQVTKCRERAESHCPHNVGVLGTVWTVGDNPPQDSEGLPLRKAMALPRRQST